MQRTPLPARLLRQRLLSLLDALPAAAAGDVTSVHRARVASRRLREVLPVLADAAGSRDLSRASKDVRRITRALGPIRELDVALGHLPDLGRRAGISARALAPLRRHLTTERQVHRQAMLDVITPGVAARLQSRLSGSHHSSTPSHHDAELASARRRAARRAARLRAEIRRAGGLYVSERLHAVRVATKKLRYALEVDRELTRSRATARIDRLRTLQDALGEIHDYEILAERTRDVQADLVESDPALATELDALLRTLATACRDGHAAFLRDRAAIQQICQRVIDAAREHRPTFR
jgi:CHAD domain-containing protein